MLFLSFSKCLSGILQAEQPILRFCLQEANCTYLTSSLLPKTANSSNCEYLWSGAWLSCFYGGAEANYAVLKNNKQIPKSLHPQLCLRDKGQSLLLTTEPLTLRLKPPAAHNLKATLLSLDSCVNWKFPPPVCVLNNWLPSESKYHWHTDSSTHWHRCKGQTWM